MINSRAFGDLEKELEGTEFINKLADKQALRDAEMKAVQKQTVQLNQQFAESQRLLQMSYSQERVLKDRIRELEGSHNRGHVNGDYLKAVVLKYVNYSQRGDMKAQTLVPVLATLLNFTVDERHAVDQSAIPQPLQLINQAVGEGVSWMRGSTGTNRTADTPELGALS